MERGVRQLKTEAKKHDGALERVSPKSKQDELTILLRVLFHNQCRRS
jgi:hypothetical protein